MQPATLHYTTHPSTPHAFILPEGSFKAWLLDSLQGASPKNRQTAFWVVFQPQQQQYQERICTWANYIHARCKWQSECTHKSAHCDLQCKPCECNSCTRKQRSRCVRVLTRHIEPRKGSQMLSSLRIHQRLYYETRETLLSRLLLPAASCFVCSSHMEASDHSDWCFLIVRSPVSVETQLLVQVATRKI